MRLKTTATTVFLLVVGAPGCGPTVALGDTRALLTDVIGGDPNRNGIFGADDPIEILRAGLPENSYIFLGMTGAVDGLEMPIGGPDAEPPALGALGCWIQQVASPDASDLDALIDYETAP